MSDDTPDRQRPSSTKYKSRHLFAPHCYPRKVLLSISRLRDVISPIMYRRLLFSGDDQNYWYRHSSTNTRNPPTFGGEDRYLKNYYHLKRENILPKISFNTPKVLITGKNDKLKPGMPSIKVLSNPQ